VWRRPIGFAVNNHVEAAYGGGRFGEKLTWLYVLHNLWID
jgi:hypothetical protein